MFYSKSCHPRSHKDTLGYQTDSRGTVEWITKEEKAAALRVTTSGVVYKL